MTLQKIKPKEEILDESLGSFPRIILPEGKSVFSTRATRLKQLAPDNPLADYLQLVAVISEAQDKVFGKYEVPAVDDERIESSQKHGMPTLQPDTIERDPVWLKILNDILQHLIKAEGVPAVAVEVSQSLATQIEENPAAIEAIADRVLADQDADPALAPAIMAALQVYWTQMVLDLGQENLPVVQKESTVCPCCGSLPVSSVVQIGSNQGIRYLSCSLCSTLWHFVRVVCSTCKSTKDISFYHLEGELEALKAETCPTCHSYRKIFYQEKDIYVDPVADDLASLQLDVLMAEEGFDRASGNPFLWQAVEEAEEK
ncbi:MAG: formate dehydrogenase accessory protein FdhE [Alcaligenaceae bacterium]|jgi:FdhE protein|nr:formate dehydrogenase accessory protein FdhE [Alcaligenaceae bacterium]HZJ98065.1 formate dehydrogenase accessory protein FdhE [Oligella sp.]